MHLGPAHLSHGVGQAHREGFDALGWFEGELRHLQRGLYWDVLDILLHWQLLSLAVHLVNVLDLVGQVVLVG